MSKSQMKVFDELYLTFKTKANGGGLPLAFVTSNEPDKASEKIRKSATNWGDNNKLKPVVIKNTPMRGFRFCTDFSTRFRSGAKYLNIEDPRGFIAELSIENTIQLLQSGSVVRGTINNACVWARKNGRYWLASVDDDEYKFQKLVHNNPNIVIKPTDLEIGSIITLKNRQRCVYMGKYYVVTKTSGTQYYSDGYDLEFIVARQKFLISILEDEDGEQYNFGDQISAVSKLDTISQEKTNEYDDIDFDEFLNQEELRVRDGFSLYGTLHGTYAFVKDSKALKNITVDMHEIKSSQPFSLKEVNELRKFVHDSYNGPRNAVIAVEQNNGDLYLYEKSKPIPSNISRWAPSSRYGMNSSCYKFKLNEVYQKTVKRRSFISFFDVTVETATSPSPFDETALYPNATKYYYFELKIPIRNGMEVTKVM